MNSESRTSGDRRANRKTLLAVALIVVAMTAAYGTAKAKSDAGNAPGVRHVSRSVNTPGSREAELIKVPVGKQLVVKQACQESPAMYVVVGDSDNRISFNGNGCTHFDPGYVVAGGETVYCVNKSAQARNCVLMGMLRKSPTANPGARFYDVEEELSKERE
jgi:hypothetical protein